MTSQTRKMALLTGVALALVLAVLVTLAKIDVDATKSSRDREDRDRQLDREVKVARESFDATTREAMRQATAILERHRERLDRLRVLRSIKLHEHNGVRPLTPDEREELRLLEAWLDRENAKASPAERARSEEEKLRGIEARRAGGKP